MNAISRSPLTPENAEIAVTNTPHQGMPEFSQEGRALSFFEFWPMWAFYPPIMLYAAWLMLRYRGILLPTVANPSFPGGGFYGESKADILSLAVQHIPGWVAPFIRVDRLEQPDTSRVSEVNAALHALDRAKIKLPVVAKPDLGCRGAGVKLIRTEENLASYIEAFPKGASFLLQKLVPYEGEAGIFYCKRPGQTKGKIISITLKYFPYAIGDGVHTLRELIMADSRASQLSHLYLRRHTERLEQIPKQGEAIRLAFAGSHSRGAIFRNGSHLVTDQMEACFDDLSSRLPEFYFGRFDIRFPDFTQVQEGRNFTIVEINGAGAESTHIWDRNTSLVGAWRALMKQYRWLFEIGHSNRARGFKTMSLAAFKRDYQREKYLTPKYPLTD
jgi:hypothetical protein